MWALALGADLGTLSQMPGMWAWGPPSPTAKNASGAGNEQRAKPSLPAKANNASVQNSLMSRVAPEQRVPAGTTHAGQAALMERSPIPIPQLGWARAQTLMTPGWKEPVAYPIRVLILALAGRMGRVWKGTAPMPPFSHTGGKRLLWGLRV